MSVYEGNCLICYEAFELDATLQALQLPCGNVVCRGCIESEFADELYFCPLCLSEHKGPTVDSITCFPCKEDVIVASVDISSTISAVQIESDSIRVPLRFVCSIEGCQNKSQHGDFCVEHMPKRPKSLRRSGEYALSLAQLDLSSLELSIKGLNERTGGTETDEFATLFRADSSLSRSSENCSIEQWTELKNKLAHVFEQQENVQSWEALGILEAAISLMKSEPNILSLKAPLVVIGDIHGQYYDLQSIFRQCNEDSTILFLGDYVDRGSFSCEVMLSLLVRKLERPYR